MKIKKYPTKDLDRNKGFFFVVALAMVLFLTYMALEWKSFYGEAPICTVGEVGDDLTENVPLVILKKPPPPPPPIDPHIFDVVPNEDDRPETDIIVSHPTSDHIVPFDSITYIKPDEDLPIHITLVEIPPIFPGCEDAADQRACFNSMIKKHITKNFRYPEAALDMRSQGRVHIMFEIQKNGSIGRVRMRGPDKILEKEAARIIDKLPQMQPGKQGGKAVRVPFSIPITFKLDE